MILRAETGVGGRFQQKAQGCRFDVIALVEAAIVCWALFLRPKNPHPIAKSAIGWGTRRLILSYKTSRPAKLPELFFQRHRQKVDGALLRVGGVGGAVSIFVVGIFEGVAGVVVDLDVDLLSQLLELLFEFVNVVGSDAAILAAEKGQGWER